MLYGLNKMMKNILAVGVLILPLQCLAAVSAGDENFLSGLFDQQWVGVKYDKLALTQGSTPQIRAFAQSELDMYRTLATRMQALDGKAPGILLTLSDGQRHDTSNRKLVDDTVLLSKLSGDQFDKEYLLRVVLTHQRMMRHDLREIDGGRGSPEVLAYARDMLATLNDQTEAAGGLYSGQVNPPGPPPP